MKVLATAGDEKKLKIATKLGAEKTVNYKTHDFSKELEGQRVNLILDCVGGSYWKQNMKVLSRDGILVLYGLLGGAKVDGPILAFLLAKRAQIRASTLMSRSDVYKANLVHDFWSSKGAKFASGDLAPVIDSQFNMSEIDQAHRYMATNQNCGKILLKMEL